LHNYILTIIRSISEQIVNMTTGRKLSVTLTTGTAFSGQAPCQAATVALRWDQTLIALQGVLIDTVAPAAIGLALTGAAILCTLGGHDEQARRMLSSGIGGYIALAIVHLPNYVLP
jgi:hypothetical protein